MRKWRLFKSQHYRTWTGSWVVTAYHTGADVFPWALELSWKNEKITGFRTLKAAQAEGARLLEEKEWEGAGR